MGALLAEITHIVDGSSPFQAHQVVCEGNPQTFCGAKIEIEHRTMNEIFIII